MEKACPGIFGKSEAYEQLYTLFTCVIDAEVLAGPE